MPPVVALVTDFGLQDAYVGAMKGAILRVAPLVTLVDVVHELRPHDVLAGALALDAAWRHFPAGTVFVAVVDPGVGSARRAVALAAAGQLFVGPDNGVFTLVLESEPRAEVRELVHPGLRSERLSPVFHGRDLFGPAAARLASGLRFAELGPVVEDPVRLALPAKARTGDAWQGRVLHVDRFGNMTTNLLEADLASLAGERLEVRVGDRRLPLVGCYAEVGVGEACALIGSSGRLELAVREGRAEALFGRDASVRVGPVR